MANYDKSTQTEEEIADEIDAQFLFAKRYLDPVHERMNRQEELYRTFIDKNKYPHQARVFDPRVFRVIETITPRMVANEPTGSFYPSGDGSSDATHILNAMTKYDWRRADMFPKQVNFVKCLLIFGTAFGRNYWDFREEEKTQMVPKKINGRLVWTPTNKKKIKVTTFDGPNFECLNIYDCYPDPNSTNLENMRWFIYRMFKTVAELEAENDARGGEYWKNLDVLKRAMEDKKNKKKAGVKPDNLQYREHRRTMLSTQELLGQDESNPDFTVLVRYTRGGWCFYVPEFAGVEGFSGIIREVENPYFHADLPIVYGVDYPYPGELYGMGEIEPIDRIQRAINAVLNQRLDNVQLNLRTMWKVKKGAGVDMHTLVSSPGNIVTTDDMAAVEAIQVPDVTGPTFVQTMTYLTSALQNGSGITDYTVGVGSNTNVGNSTATGTRLIQSEANAQFKLKIQLYSHMVITRIVNQWKDLRIQYTTEEQKLRIIGTAEIKEMRDKTKLSQTGQDGKPIAPGEDKTAILEIKSDNFAFLNLLPDSIQPSIVGDYDFIATVSADQLQDPTVMQENFFAALDRVQSPAWAQGLFRFGKMVNVVDLTQKIFEKLQVGLDGKDILTDFPKGQNFNFDMPKVNIKYEDLPPDGKVAAAANAGIQIDPNNPQLQQMGTTRVNLNADADKPPGDQIFQNEGFMPGQQPTQPMQQDPSQGGQPLNDQQIQDHLGQVQQDHAASTQAAHDYLNGPGGVYGK